MNALDELLIDYIAASWRSVHSEDFIERANATYDAYLAGGGNDEHYKKRWWALKGVFAKRLHKALRANRTTGYFYINGDIIYFEDGFQVCPECKAPHDDLRAECRSCMSKGDRRVMSYA